MARQPEVNVEGNPLPNVLEVAFGIEATIDADGVPTGHQRMLGIEMRRVADGQVDMAAWASSADSQNRCSGEILFFDNAGSEVKRLTWEKGYLSEYDVYLRDGRFEERLVIRARYLSMSAASGPVVEFDLGDLWWRS